MRQPTPPRLLAALSFAAMLTACGGGNGGVTDPVSMDPAQLKGRWVTPTGATAMTAVFLPDASGTATAWMLAQDASRLVKLVAFSDRSANGISYTLRPNNDAGQAVRGQIQITTTSTSSPKQRIVFTNSTNAETLVFDQSDTLASPAVQADAEGAWSTVADTKVRVTRWTVAATGGITGSTTTGCSYTGKLSAMSSSNAYGVQFNEYCPDGTETMFSGIATLDEPKSRLTVTATTADTTRGVALFFGK